MIWNAIKTLMVVGIVTLVGFGFYQAYQDFTKPAPPRRYYALDRCIALGGVPIQNGWGKLERCDFPFPPRNLPTETK